MEKEEIACRIIQFWYIMEFLSQDKFPAETVKNATHIKNLKQLVDGSNLNEEDRGKFINIKKIILFHDFHAIRSVKEQINCDNDIFKYHQEIGTSKHLCVGKLKREFLIKVLYACLGIKDNRPEEDKSKICLMAIKVNDAGFYEAGSLRISPILWGVYECYKAGCKIDETIICTKNYNKALKEFEDTIATTELLDSEKILKLYDAVCKQYIEPLIQLLEYTDSVVTEDALYIYTRYKDVKTFQRECVSEADYSELINSFYMDDLLMVKQAISQISSSHGEGLSNEILDYIVGTYKESIGKEICSNKIDIRNSKKSIAEWLSAGNSPLGKWPAKYAPALMQQIAINIAISDNKSNKRIFSVNGPPGTGKTTLLKEIIASNIVERAKLLSEYEKPDDAFITNHYEDGLEKEHGYDDYMKYYYSFRNPAISQYGMLVASCNNAAVENITKELPDGEKLLDGLESGKDVQKDIKKGLTEIASFFCRNESDQRETYRYYVNHKEEGEQEGKRVLRYIDISDIYFSKLAADLMSNEEQIEILDENQNKKSDKDNVKVKNFAEWGLISAPMGKRDNINKYYYWVLKELIEHFLLKNKLVENRVTQYSKARDDFNKQWKVVLEKKEDLVYFMKLSQEYHSLENQLKQLRTQKINVKELQGNHAYEQAEQKKLNIVYEALCDTLTEKEDARKWYEIFFGKWIITERLRQIAKLKKEQQEAEKKIDDMKLVLESLLQQQQKAEDEYHRSFSSFKNTRKKWQDKQRTYKGTMTEVNNQFWTDFFSTDEKVNTRIQISNPWTWYAYNREREKLFYYALLLHKEFILSSKCCRSNFINLALMWNYRENNNRKQCDFSERDKRNAYAHLLNTLFLLTPVMSTTFASVGRFLNDIDKPGSLGTLIIDEAGQASPHVAIGALWRCQKAIIVGDPKQVEPVVTDDADAIKNVFSNDIIRPYLNKTISVQGFADKINRYGTNMKNSIDEEAASTWVGCPLVVHRRCLNPMFSISNELSYAGTMKLQTQKPKEGETDFIESESCWINVKGKEKGDKDHYVDKQGDMVCELLKEKFEKNDTSDLYIISPFKTVIEGIKSKIEKSELCNESNGDQVRKWLDANCGTVHKFQGKEAKEVIFLLGCDEKAVKAIKWVNANIVNVAVTRAKYRLYVIGDYDAWQISGVFKIMKRKLPFKKML